jgi:hypothetical protein
MGGGRYWWEGMADWPGRQGAERAGGEGAGLWERRGMWA